jgi:hypothetical protein
MLRPAFFSSELRLFKVADNDGCKELIHALLVRDFMISPAPYKQKKVQKFENGFFEEEFHLLVGAFNIFVDFFSEELVGFLCEEKGTVYLFYWGLMGPIMRRGFFFRGYLMGDFLEWDLRAYYFFS